VSSALLALKRKAAADKKHRFRSLLRMVSEPMLHESFHRLRKAAAPGVDAVTWQDYEVGVGERIADLHERIHTGRYRAREVRRRYIPKGGSRKLRPLGIPSIEDKIVQDAVRRILEAIYEEDFLESSMGYRPGRGPREASQKLQNALFYGRMHWVVEADIEGFFDHVDHDWLERMLKERIDDRSLLRLIRKWLRAGIMETDGQILHPVTGTPQGGIISPILANVYLHYALDLWVERVVKKRCEGQVLHQRYADDFVVGFEYGSEAQGFLAALRERLAKFGLKLSESKSGIVRFSRCDPKGSRRFSYLGFDFYWGKARSGKPTVRRRSSQKKIRASLQRMKDWLKHNRNRRPEQLREGLNQRLNGHYNYYGVIGNSSALRRYHESVKTLCYKWWNRRSQRRSYNWTGFEQLWQNLGISPPTVRERAATFSSQSSLTFNPAQP
jgi:group II intron reverse transcriptase/maturase